MPFSVSSRIKTYRYDANHPPRPNSVPNRRSTGFGLRESCYLLPLAEAGKSQGHPVQGSQWAPRVHRGRATRAESGSAATGRDSSDSVEVRLRFMTDTFTAAKRSQIMARIRSSDTAPEKALRQLIHRLGCRFRLHRTDLPGKPDIVLPKHRLAVFMHGCFWHGHDCKDGRRPASNTDYWNSKLDRNAIRDKKNLRELRRLGWRCAVIWECQLEKPTQLEWRLRRLLERGV